METKIVQPIEIYTESTPNPASLKYSTNQMLLPQMIFEATQEEGREDSSLATAIFRDHPYIERVFISNHFITLTKMECDKEWFEISLEMKPFLKEFLASGEAVVSQAYVSKEQAARKEREQKAEEGTDDAQKIQQLLDKYVRPAVETDGGHIAFKSYENGVVTLIMQGACSGCPSSTATLKDGIESLLKRMVPGVEEVVAQADVD